MTDASRLFGVTEPGVEFCVNLLFGMRRKNEKTYREGTLGVQFGCTPRERGSTPLCIRWQPICLGRLDGRATL
jgi:hypothetical protein